MRMMENLWFIGIITNYGKKARKDKFRSMEPSRGKQRARPPHPIRIRR